MSFTLRIYTKPYLRSKTDDKRIFLCYNGMGRNKFLQAKEMLSLKKITKQTKSNLLNAFLILGTIGLVIYLGAKNGDIGASIDAIKKANPIWLMLAFLAWFINIVFESLVNQVFFIQQKVNIKFISTLHITFIGQFYSSVTPAATGGQPMQVFAFKKRGVPTGVSSSALAVKFFCFQMAVLSMGAVLWIIQPEFMATNLAAGKWLVIAGFFINGLTVAAVLLLAINRNIVRAIILLILKLGKALHLVKDIARSCSRCDAALDDFRASVDMVSHHPMHLLKLLILSYIQVAFFMSVSYCVYRGLGLSGTPYLPILTLQLLLFIGAAFSPLPGASGAQEGGFYLFFSHVISSDYILAALLLWRFFTYYITLIIGLGSVIVESTVSINRIKKRNALQGEQTSDTDVQEEQNEA